MLFDLSRQKGGDPFPPDLPQHEDEPSPPIDFTIDLSEEDRASPRVLPSLPSQGSFGRPSLPSQGSGRRSPSQGSGRLSPSSSFGSDVPRHLEHVKDQARLRQRRLRLPTVGGGAMIGFLGLASTFLPLPHHAGIYFGYSIAGAGCFLGLLGLLPSDRRAVRMVGLYLVIPGSLVTSFMLSFEALGYYRILQEGLWGRACMKQDESFPCWYFCIRLALRICDISFCLLVVARVARSACRVSSPILLSTIWSSFGWFYLCIGITSVPKATSVTIVGARVFAEVVFQLSGGSLFTILAWSAFSSYLRAHVQSWFMSRGTAATAAAGIAELLGGRDIQNVLSEARSSFSYVAADSIEKEHIADNYPNPALAVFAQKGRLGFVDAFLSHSWHDDPDLKWLALQKLRGDFKAKHQREPTLWIDKYSLNQDDIDSSLACLPVYLSGCNQLWILCGKTYLERLWCLVEIFVFLQMGGKRSQLRVEMLGNLMEGSNDLSMNSLDDALRNFDPRYARCFTEYDTERLHAVIENSGYDQISELVNEIFLGLDEGP